MKVFLNGDIAGLSGYMGQIQHNCNLGMWKLYT